MEPEGPSDEMLMASYVTGDRQAFTTLFARLVPRLHRFFRRSFGSEATADIVEPGGVTTRPSIAIPATVAHAEVWFENYGNYPGTPGPACTACDSNLGSNYSFDVN